MKRLIQIQSHSFRKLLYLEWLLLGMGVLTEVLPAPHHQSTQFQLLIILAIAGFGGLGLRLPTGKPISKVLYTSLEFGLLLLPMFLESRAGIRCFPLLCFIVVIRSCLIFRPRGRLIVAGVAFMSFLLALFLRIRVEGREPPPMVQEQLKFTFLLLKLNSALSFGLALVFVLLLINALVAQRQSREKLMLANEQLRQYALRIKDQVTLQERNRIARDIHDSLGHSLTIFEFKIQNSKFKHVE